jgi:predicted Rossmann fold nucleotide-binding protein DprA/Smf involved in DNA uptake
MREMADSEKLVPEDPRYPPRLREGKKKKEKDWPPTLFCRGNLELLASDRLVAIVGSRRVGRKAVEATKELARRLAGSGWVIVSGFARGIDQAAFEGALADPGGQTIAVLAQGLDEQLRDEDQRLMEEKLATCGERLLVVSPFPPGEPWSGRNAMTRNAIIVGLARWSSWERSGRSGHHARTGARAGAGPGMRSTKPSVGGGRCGSRAICVATNMLRDSAPTIRRSV